MKTSAISDLHGRQSVIDGLLHIRDAGFGSSFAPAATSIPKKSQRFANWYFHSHPQKLASELHCSEQSLDPKVAS
jgi:hypothetical protein